MKSFTDEDFTAVHSIHEDHADDGLLTFEDCIRAAQATRLVNDELAVFLRDRAEEMDRPVSVEDVMTSVRQWADR